MLTLYIDVANNRILGADALDAVLPRFVHGDQTPLKLLFVDEDFTQIAPPTSVCVALSKLGQKPSDGTFTLTYGGDETAAIAYSATAAQLASALNALASITAAGGVTVSGAAGGPWSVVFDDAGVRTEVTNDAELLYPPSQVISNVEVTGTSTVRHRFNVQLSRNPAAFVDTWTTVGVGAAAHLEGVLNLATAGIDAILGTSDLIQDAVLEIQTVTDGEQTTVQRRDVTLVADVIDGAPTTPPPNSTFVTQQQLQDELATVVGGIKTPEAVTASRDIVDADSGKYLYNETASEVELTLTGSPGGYTDNRPASGALDWVTPGYGALGYWLPRGGGDLSSGIGASLVATGGTRYDADMTASFYAPAGTPEHKYFIYIPSGTLVLEFTTTGPTRVRILIHTGAARTLNLDNGAGFTASAADPADGTFSNPYYWDIIVPAGDHVWTFSPAGDNPGINGVLFDTATSEELPPSEPGPLTIGQEIEMFQVDGGAVTIVPGGNTVVSKGGYSTNGAGCLIRLKKIGENTYHLSGDLSA